MLRRSLLVASRRTCRTAASLRPHVTLRAVSSAAVDAADVAPPEVKSGRLISELERLQQLPWWQSGLLRLGGTFGDEQWQAAAGGDMYLHVLAQSDLPIFTAEAGGRLPERFYTRLQLRGLHAWVAHVRLREEPKESHAVLFREMMEHVWDQASLDLSHGVVTDGERMGYIEISKHLKASQFSWHGFCKNLDAALASDAPRDEMTALLVKNMFVDEEGDPLVDEEGAPFPEVEAGARWLCDYLLAQRDHLAALPADDVLKGRISWAELQAQAPA